MLEQILGAVAVLLALTAGWLFTKVVALQSRVVELDAELAEAKRKPTRNQRAAKSAEPAVDTSALDRELDDARGEIKELKKQLYDVKQDNKDLKKQVEEHEDAKPAPVNSDVVFSLREEIAELKGEVARLEQEAKDAKKARKEAPRVEAAPPPKREAKPADEGGESIADLRRQMERELADARAEAQKEVKDLEGRLKKTASNVDKQRRRADNNDRAYKITQRQLDAAQERIELLEAQVKKAGFASQAAAAGQAATERQHPAAAPAAAPAPAAAAAIVNRKSERAAERERARSEATEDEPPVGSKTAILSSAAFARDDEQEQAQEPPAEAAQDEAEPVEDTGSTVKSRPIASGEAVAAAAAEAAASAETADDEDEEESGGSTQVLSSAALRAMATPEDSAAVTAEMPRATEVARSVVAATSEPDDDAGDDDTTSATPGLSLEEPSADGKPSAGLFGIPDEVLNAQPEEEQDPNRSTQFAFPAAQSGDLSIEADPPEDDEKAGSFEREASGVLTGMRLKSFAVEEGDNPAEEPTPDVPGGASPPTKRLGETSSVVDDAWADLDFD